MAEAHTPSPLWKIGPATPKAARKKAAPAEKAEAGSP
jgi:hypothetical protein